LTVQKNKCYYIFPYPHNLLLYKKSQLSESRFNIKPENAVI